MVIFDIMNREFGNFSDFDTHVIIHKGRWTHNETIWLFFETAMVKPVPRLALTCQPWLILDWFVNVNCLFHMSCHFEFTSISVFVHDPNCQQFQREHQIRPQNSVLSIAPQMSEKMLLMLLCFASFLLLMWKHAIITACSTCLDVQLTMNLLCQTSNWIFDVNKTS